MVKLDKYGLKERMKLLTQFPELASHALDSRKLSVINAMAQSSANKNRRKR